MKVSDKIINFDKILHIFTNNDHSYIYRKDEQINKKSVKSSYKVNKKGVLYRRKEKARTGEEV